MAELPIEICDMKRQLLSLLLTFSLSFALFCSPTGAAKQEEQQLEPKPVVEMNEIPLGTIYTTGRQKELKSLKVEFDPLPKGKKKYKAPFGLILDQLLQEYRGGASSIFVLEGDNVAEAMRGTLASLTQRYIPLPKEKGKKDPRDKEHWMVVYLGIADGECPAWIVTSAKREQTTITFSCRKAAASHKEPLPYFYWVPLGSLKPNTYTLQLFDGDEKQIALSRREKIPFRVTGD